VLLSSPHPRNYLRAFADPANAPLVDYVRRFQMPGAAAALNVEELSFWVDDPEDRKALLEALSRSDPEAMLGFYKANIPPANATDIGPLPLVRAPTLALFGTDDPYVPASAFDGTFREVDNVSSVLALPGAGHFIHHQAAAFVTREIEAWVAQPPSNFRHLA